MSLPYNHRPGEFESGTHAKQVMGDAQQDTSKGSGAFGSATPQQMPMDETELMAVIREFEQESYGYSSGSLASQRAYAIERYLALPYGDEIDGRSGVVDTGLRDTIEWIMPQVLRVFLGGDRVVKLNPTNETDEEAAEQETDYVNHVILEKNDAFNIFSTWFRDAMMAKMGYVKAYWQQKHDVLRETYKGITDDQLMMVAQDPDVEVISDNPYPDPTFPPQPPQAPPQAQPPQPMGAMPQQPAPPVQGMPGPQAPPPPPMLHDVVLRRIKTQGYVKIDNVPAEEIKIHRSTRSIALDDCLFIRHSARRTISSLRQDGYEIDDDIPDSGDDMGNVQDQISISRDRFADDSDLREDLNYIDASARRVWLHEDYVRVDYDGDGIAELRKVCHIGNQILANEEYDIVPFAAVTPIVFPHRHVGIGFDDLCDEPSKVATALQRGMLDNLYLQNNGRYGIDVAKVNVDDMLVSRPGGLVRTEGPPGDSIFPFTHPAAGAAAMEGLQWAQRWREVSTGVSPDQSGLSADALSNTAPGTVAQVVAAGQTRVEAVARSFATGVKELFSIVHALTLKNATHDEKIKLNNKWVTVDPREWVKRTSMTITVGLGTGTKESRIMGLQMLAGMQQQGMGIGIADPKGLYHTGELLTQEMGYKDPDAFWVNPNNPGWQPPPQQPPPPVQVAQINQQGEQQKLMAQTQADAQKFQAQTQLEQQKVMLDAQAKDKEQQNALALQASNDQRDAMRAQQQHERDMQKMALDNQFKYDQMHAKFQFDAAQKEMDRQSQERMTVHTANVQAQTAQATAPKEQPDRHGELVQLLKTPKKVTRNPDGSFIVQHAA